MSKKKYDISSVLSKAKGKGSAIRRKKYSAKDAFNISVDLLFAAVIIIGLVKIDIFNVIFSSLTIKYKEYETYGDIKSVCEQLSDLSAEEIKSRKPVYVVELDEYVAPKPDMSKFDEAFENYEDDTIEVHYYKERKYESWFHYVDVKIKHPSQFRFALADDKYSATKWIRKLPTKLSAEVNAVCAVNGMFYNIRSGGVLIYKRELLQNNPFGLDVLLIDSDGNFHIVEDTKIESSGVLEKYDIVSGLSFGPKLVENGEELKITKLDWEPRTKEPRTAICQFYDDLHYLICLCEGRNSFSIGVRMQTFANEIASKGVKVAYNLDGGRSGTVIIGNQLKNMVGWGPMKPESDILYFATAIQSEEQTEDTQS